MTVEQAIAKLSLIEDKSKELSFDRMFGTNEHDEPLDVTDITEAMDCVIIS